MPARPHARGGDRPGRVPVNLSVPAPLFDAYRAGLTSGTLQPLSALLQGAMAAELLAHGLEPPPAPPPTRTAAATAASRRARLERPGR